MYKDRGAACDIISEMLDNPDSAGNYQTTNAYNKFEAYIAKIRAEIPKWKDGFPPDSLPVLAVTTSRIAGSVRMRRSIVRAQFIRHKEVEINPDDDTESVDWYDETDNCYYVESGWYEVIDYWEDYGYLKIDDPVIAWMPMPKLPEIKDDA